jgi:hypothetical protein
MALGLWAYMKLNQIAPLIIGLAYLCFSLSYVMILMGYQSTMPALLILLRLLGYCGMIVALLQMVVSEGD